jgi:predicted nuclease of predicted toxin-antitoxin system
MRFLADESCDFAVVRALRAANHDVLAVAELWPGTEDSQVIREAPLQERVLVTEDRDFGQLVFAANHESGGVIYLRFPATARAAMASAVVDFVARHPGTLVGHFIVLQPGRARISRP